VKVLAQSCDLAGCTATGTASDVAAGIMFAADAGAQVINLSLGNASQAIFGPSFQEALDYAWHKGSIPVLAAGNDFLLPSGGAAHAIVVGALQRDGTRAAYSNIGTSPWSISAPGGSFEGDTKQSCKEAPQTILSTYLNGYACESGTSMAAPHVSGAAAVLRGLGYSPQDTVDRLLATARPAEAGTGAGALDLAATVGQPPTPPPNSTLPEQTTAPATSSGGIVGDDGATNSTESSGAPTASPPSGDLGGPTSTSPPVINMPSQRAAAAAPGRVTARSATDDGLSPGLVVVAVLMALGVGFAAGWFALRGSSLARRTPPL
jgi:subtilisin family serine protease